MAMTHTVQAGESLLSISKYYGFGSIDPIKNHPDNQTLLSERGDGGLHPGDELVLPFGRQGETERGTGRGHTLTVRQIPTLFEVRVFTEFRKEDPLKPGFKEDKPENTWRGLGSAVITQISATVEIKKAQWVYVGLPEPAGGRTNSKTGVFSTTTLWQGKWKITITPDADQLSTGPASADAQADHGRGFYETEGRIGTRDSEGKPVPPPAKPYPLNKNFELEYRPLELEVVVEDDKIVSAGFAGPPAPSRPQHAVLFWKNLSDTENKQVLEIDWKPDFLRRVVGQLRPRHRERTASVDVVVFHHTGGFSVGGTLPTFLGEETKSGAHFIVDIDGHVIRMADDRYELRHGGGDGSRKAKPATPTREAIPASPPVRDPSWRGGSPSINDCSIGIEHLHTDDTLKGSDLTTSKPYTEAQYDATIDLIRGIKAVHGVKSANIIGHQDIVSKAMCPGRMVDWARLEAAGISNAPAMLEPSEQSNMFGGFYSGEAGKSRQLTLGSSEKDLDDGFHVFDDHGVLIIGGLAGGPITALREDLRQIGYSVEEWIRIGSTIHTLTVANRRFFEETLGFALSQFIRHYCTLSRARPDLSQAYRESPRVWTKLFVDFELAKLVRGAAKAAINSRGGPL